MSKPELELWGRLSRTHGRPGNVMVNPESGEGMSKSDREALCALLRRYPVWNGQKMGSGREMLILRKVKPSRFNSIRNS